MGTGDTGARNKHYASIIRKVIFGKKVFKGIFKVNNNKKRFFGKYKKIKSLNLGSIMEDLKKEKTNDNKEFLVWYIVILITFFNLRVFLFLEVEEIESLKEVIINLNYVLAFIVSTYLGVKSFQMGSLKTQK